MNTHLVGNKKLEIDITKTLSYLRSQRYYTEHYYIVQKSIDRQVKHTEGIVFMHPRQIKKLE